MENDDKIRIGYQTSIQLIAYQGQIIWRAFSALVAVNTGLAAIVGAALKLFPNLATGIKVLAGLGIAICVAWLIIIIREFHYYRYWYAWARHYERRLSPEVQITTIGKTYGEGGTIEANENVPNVERFGSLARTFNVHLLMKFVVLVYIGIYILLILASGAPQQGAALDA
jgi:hypothetical protein